jgi:hypothetical protein
MVQAILSLLGGDLEVLLVVRSHFFDEEWEKSKCLFYLRNCKAWEQRCRAEMRVGVVLVKIKTMQNGCKRFWLAPLGCRGGNNKLASAPTAYSDKASYQERQNGHNGR